MPGGGNFAAGSVVYAGSCKKALDGSAGAELGGDSGRDTSLCRRYIPVSRMAGRYLAATLPPSPPPLSTAKDSPLSWLNRQVAVKISKDWSRP